MQEQGYKIKEINEVVCSSYQYVFNLDEFRAKLFTAIGFTGENVLNFLVPRRAIQSAESLVNGVKASERIKAFVKSNEHFVIWIFGDYDVDGMTSSLILKHALDELILLYGANGEVKIYLPDRSDGYGINEEWAEQVNDGAPTLVITVDNGTSAKKAIDVLNRRKIPVIVTDHHQPEKEISDCLIINPSIYESDPNKHLAGCGVAFKLGTLLTCLEHMLEVVDLLALGTIGDMMPMVEENIAFCKLGLERMNSDKCHPVISFLKPCKEITFKDLGFDIIPKLNSCGRMGCMNLGLEYILAPDQTNADIISELNEERKSRVKKFKGDALEEDTGVIVLEECGLGIAGLIAGQLSQEKQRDVIVLTEVEPGILKGSGRAFAGDLLAILEEASKRFKTLKASGHKEACGVVIAKKEIEAFRTYFDNIQPSIPMQVQEGGPIEVDMALNLSDVNMNTLNVIQSIPYDRKTLTEPIFVIKADVDKKERTKNNADNVWLYLSDGNKKLKVWAKDMAEKAFSLKSKKGINLIATMDKDFMNTKYATIKILDIIE